MIGTQEQVVTHDLHHKFSHGHALTDQELDCLINYYGAITAIKGSTPAKYQLMFSDAFAKLCMLEGYKLARQEIRGRTRSDK